MKKVLVIALGVGIIAGCGLIKPAKAEEFIPYVGVFVASDKHDKSLYHNDSSYNGVSIGATYDFNETFFLRGEIAGTEHDANPNVGLGVRFDSTRFTVGVGSGQERARYTFDSPFPQGHATDKYTFNFVEVEHEGLFARYVDFHTDFNFDSNYTTYDNGVPINHRTAKDVSEDRSLVQVGYRVRF